MAIDMAFSFSASIWYWKGPAPHYFVTVPDSEARELRQIMKAVTYGWGMIPVKVSISGTEFSTSLFPKNGGYIVPIKAVVRKKYHLDEGDTVEIELVVMSNSFQH